MRKGIMFSIDAFITVALIIGMFGVLTTLNTGGSGGEAQQALLLEKSSASAQNAYLTGAAQATQETGGAEKASCTELHDYRNGEVVVGVKRCAQLE